MTCRGCLFIQLPRGLGVQCSTGLDAPHREIWLPRQFGAI
ncbi:hypothetical protein Lokhon_01193 [Limimaricola hongkongensis DSM 17492]|uniref:Uncharacterized protein n=1 Tax=Limimaricola hongkongensis DSM 17492 TaxID=1122180 RepID=A0A017HF18_9RHOB|nr:hypothetical protein Lokhon_01193 [Limimaricola hongkongensis DSM 17492]